LLRSARETPVLIAGPRIAQPAHFQALGCEVLNVDSVADLLAEFGRRRFTNVLVEGGSGALGSFRDAGLIDDVHVFVAPHLVGGKNAPSPLGRNGAEMIGDGMAVEDWTCDRCGGDFYINGRTTKR
jgi:diaminohydroxyphosphoribosylaminopyrimidine deaminase / 5-amino-6-(5-phosphoribosylamino)uracil reductase